MIVWANLRVMVVKVVLLVQPFLMLHGNDLWSCITSEHCWSSPVTWAPSHVPVSRRPACTNCVFDSRRLTPVPPPFLESSKFPFPFTLLLFINTGFPLFIHPFIHSFISLCPSPRVVSSVLWRSRMTVFSLCFFTPLFNKVLNQGHHLRLLCASMTSPPVKPWV